MNRRLRSLLSQISVVLVVSAVGHAHAQCVTNVSGSVSGSWSESVSPICLTANAVVPAGQELSIGPGVEVFAMDDSIGLSVQGTLQAVGTAQQPIEFKPMYVNQGWLGLYFLPDAAAGSRLEHFTVTGSIDVGITIDSVPNPPAISDCEITDNTWTYQSPAQGIDLWGGAGLRVYLSGPATVDRCRIANNAGLPAADGLSRPAGGVLVYGGRLNIRDSVISANTVTGTSDSGHGFAGGGGVFVSGGSEAILLLEESRVENNGATVSGCCTLLAQGGGIWATSGWLAIYNSVFAGNWADADSGASLGGAISTSSDNGVEAVIVSSTFYGNAADAGGAIHTGDENEPGIPFLTTVANSIFWNNGQSIGGPGTNDVIYSIVEGGFAGEGNLSANPAFFDVIGDPWLHVTPFSPAVDNGHCEASAATDIDGEPRPFGASCDIGVDEVTANFGDVDTGFWAFNWIEALARNGITAGCGGGNYCPADPVTRAQMAVFLERGMHGSDFAPPAATGTVFNDVGSGDFAASFIEQLHADGITAGCGNDNFCPNAVVSRAQMAVFLIRALKGPGYSPHAATGVFNDVPVNHWAAAWIEHLADLGITAGCGGGNYCPDAAVNRDQMAIFLIRTFGM